VILRWALGRWHLHSTHDGVRHIHLHSHAQDKLHYHAHALTDGRWALGVGLLHGLAGSGTVLGMSLVSWSLWGVLRVALMQGTV